MPILFHFLSNKKEVIALLNNQIELISFMPKIASMEDVFIKMLNEKKT